MWRLTAAALVLALFAPAPADDPDLVAGIGLVKDGDFEAAVLRLDGAVRRLEAAKGPAPTLARAYLYLGLSYLELDQEPTARGKFREALRQDPALRLDPHQFSPQAIRVFEATRLEAGVPPPAASERVPASSPPATTTPERKKKGSATPLLLIAGGGAAAAGIAVAAGGGGSGASATTTLAVTTTLPVTTTTTATTTTTTTTTTTQPGNSCSYTITPAQVDFTKNGGTASCAVRTSAACTWTAESTESWLHVLGVGAGVGNGTIRFAADENKDNKARSGRIRLRERKSVHCDVQQSDQNFAPGDVTLVLTSELSLGGGSGQVVLNGIAASFQGAGRHEFVARERRGENRLEATVVAAAGGPGTWRFDFPGLVEGGGPRVLAGEVAQLTASSVVFRLQGRAGERLVLLWQGRR